MEAHEPKAIQVLKEAYGKEVLLVDAEDVEQPFVIMAEFSLGEKSYAALQSPAMSKEQEVDLFLIVTGEDGNPELESIEDDEEWETAAEAYDELLFLKSEQQQ